MYSWGLLPKAREIKKTDKVQLSSQHFCIFIFFQILKQCTVLLFKLLSVHTFVVVFFLRIWLILYIKRILTNFLWPYRWHNQLESPNITWPQSLLMFAPTTSFLDLKIMNMNIGRRKFPLIPNKWNISSSQRMIK